MCKIILKQEVDCINTEMVNIIGKEKVNSLNLMLEEGSTAPALVSILYGALVRVWEDTIMPDLSQGCVIMALKKMVNMDWYGMGQMTMT